MTNITAVNFIKKFIKMEELSLAAIIVLAITTIINGTISYKFSQTLQKEKFEVDYRQKASIVAEMFSIWHQGSHSKQKLTPDDYKKLNKLAWECTFWLSDDIIQDINNRLQNVHGAKDLKEILVDVRKYLNPKKTRIDWQRITHF